MELHPLVPSCRANIVHTYLALAQANPSTRIEEREGYVLAQSVTSSPVSNFLIGLDVPREGEARLLNEIRELSAQTRATRVFVIAGDSPSEQSAFFRMPGWWCGHRIEVMVAEGMPGAGGETLQWAQTTQEREAVCELMSEQFFSRMSRPAMELTKQSTFRAEADLAYIGTPDELLAAVMVTESPGMLGIYNLVVRKSSRGQGLGRAMVEAVKRRAYAENRSITLQCDGSLGLWYQAQGFKMVGNLSTFHLNLLNCDVR